MINSFVTAPGNKAFFQEKAFSFGIAILLILSLTPIGVANAYLILGHSHFMMTALYQYKAGRITPPKLIIYLILFGLMFKIGHMYPHAYTLFASAFLIVHVFSGEIRHFKRQFTLPYLLMTSSIMILLCAWLAMKLWDVSFNMPVLLMALNFTVLFSCYSYYQSRKNLPRDAFFPFLVVLYAFFAFLEYSGHVPSSYDSFGLIVIAHYLTTYFNVNKSFRARSPEKARTFIKESILMNLVFLAGYFIVFYGIGKNNPLYTYVYDPISFYVWTVMHFITTWNNQEYKYIFKKAYA